MQFRCFILSLLLLVQESQTNAYADVLELSGAIESGRFIDGVNITKNQLSAALRAEWSGESGAFASLYCFMSENQQRLAIQRGCDASAGWFTPINELHALTFAVSRHDYSSTQLNRWEYTDLSVSWHLGKTTMLKLRGSDSLLGQGFSSVTTSVHFTKPLNDNWRVQLEAGLSSLQSSAPVDNLKYGVLSAQSGRGAWVTELNLMLSSSDYKRFVRLAIDEPEIGVRLRYRFY